jgi:hypothetical protein
VSRIPTEIIEAATGQAVPSDLCVDLSPVEVLAVEQVWGPRRLEAVLRLIQSGVRWQDLPEHTHWNWANKIHGYVPLAHRFLGVECAGEMQSLARVDLVGHSARCGADAGKPLVYIDFLESAPWNARQFTATPRYKLAGLRLVEAAMRLSAAEGFHGRVGLHALPQAVGFYQGACGMTAFGPDTAKENLIYLELPRDVADRWIQGGRP